MLAISLGWHRPGDKKSIWPQLLLGPSTVLLLWAKSRAFAVHSACISSIPLGVRTGGSHTWRRADLAYAPCMSFRFLCTFLKLGRPIPQLPWGQETRPAWLATGSVQESERGNDSGGGRASRLPHRCPTVAVLSLSVCVLPVRPSSPAPPRATIPDLHSHPHQRTSTHTMHDS